MAKTFYRIKDHNGAVSTVPEAVYKKMKEKTDTKVTLIKEIKADYVTVKSHKTGETSTLPTRLLPDLERNGDVEFVEEYKPKKGKPKAKKKKDAGGEKAEPTEPTQPTESNETDES